MAEESFYDLWEITTDEEVEILLRAFEDAKKRGPRPPSDVLERLERGRRLLEEGYFDDL
ncbi:MAG: hypothetical protein FWF07_03645 [Methanomassiliicoccaceae archaeon]|nr:hypothetical protein [Methanomassiliicoccaceae archaeon]